MKTATPPELTPERPAKAQSPAPAPARSAPSAKEAAALTPKERVAPAELKPDAQQVASTPLPRVAGHDKTVEVKIGSIEIRAAAPPPPPKTPEPATHPGKPTEGFEAYRGVRQYSAWFRE